MASSLLCAGNTIGVDAPCSGIHMLWTGLYLTLACLYRLNTWQTWRALGVAMLALVLGNAWRTAALFYPEAGIVAVPPWAHDGIGAVTFLAMAASLVWYLQHLATRQPASRQETSA